MSRAKIKELWLLFFPWLRLPLGLQKFFYKFLKILKANGFIAQPRAQIFLASLKNKSFKKLIIQIIPTSIPLQNLFTFLWK